MTLGEKIRALRTQAGMKQEDLAQKIGVGMRIVSFYETNKSIPSTEVVRRLAEVFGVTTDFLIYENDSQSGVIRDRELMKYMLTIDQMTHEDQLFVKRLLRSVIVETRVKEVAAEPKDIQKPVTIGQEATLFPRKPGRLRLLEKTTNEKAGNNRIRQHFH